MPIFDDLFDVSSPIQPPLLSGSNSGSHASLRLNISSTPTHYIVRALLPGIPQNQISVDINEDGLLNIQAESHSKDEKEKTEDDENEIVKEIWVSQGKLHRSVKFPRNDVDIDGVKAELNNGDLIIKVPKKKTHEEKFKKKNIKIIKGKL